MKKENVIGENVEAGTNAESDEKAGIKINFFKSPTFRLSSK